MTTARSFLFLAATTFLFLHSHAAILINEVADQGTADVCNGNDWIELLPSEDATVDLAGFVLYDDNGPNDADAYIFPSPTILNPGEHLLLCCKVEEGPQFGIGGSDTVTLADASGTVVSTTGPLQDRGVFGVSFAYDATLQSYVYTTTPTPGFENEITPLSEPSETVEQLRARLVAQNDLGMQFFNMDTNGLVIEGGYDEVVDLRIYMNPQLWQQMYEERSYEVYQNFDNATISSTNGTVLLNLTSPGRMRPKGQSTLSFGTCMDRSIPYSIDWNHVDSNQTLFGVQRSYLRTHFGDSSFVREWSMHRMLARFGLPHLRTRTVRLFVNDEYVGLYELLEAPDQDYVFQRSFSGFDPTNYGLYKVKTLSLGCGTYDEESLDEARMRMNETDTPPYVFERGEHRPIVPVLRNWDGCAIEFGESISNEFQDVTLAYVRGGEDCGKVLVDEGLVDRDLGVKSLDETMQVFINQHLASNTCNTDCSNSDLSDDVDIDNFLRNFAVMAATLNSDSPLGNGNNYYLAHVNGKWAIVQYDHNNILSSTSADLCDAQKCLETLPKWSIVRPTCRDLETSQMAGPLLTNDTLHAKYIDYVQEFVTSVMTNETFLDQVLGHLEAIQPEVPKDPWNDLATAFDLELDQNGEWFHLLFGFPYIPFLPTLQERALEIQKQLDALDAGTFPRALDDIRPNEVCVDWEAEGPRESACPENCGYEGCYRPELAVSGFCDEDTGVCFHGVLDSNCEGIDNEQGYDGMEGFEGSDQPTFCWLDPTLGSLRLAQCPEYATGASSVVHHKLHILAAVLSFIVSLHGMLNL